MLLKASKQENRFFTHKAGYGYFFRTLPHILKKNSCNQKFKSVSVNIKFY